MRKPLKAPAAPPTASPSTPARTWLHGLSVIVVPTTTLASDTTAPALRSNPPVSTTSVWPIAAKASVPPVPTIVLKSK